MEVYLSDEERVEALKKWWKENAKAVIAGVALGLAAMAGWNAWQTSQRHKAEEASSLYQNLLKAVEAKQADSAMQLSERLHKQFGGTIYATYGGLFQAKLKVEAGDLAGAKQILEQVLAQEKDENFQHLARLRLGYVLLAMGQGSEALRMIESLPSEKTGKFERLYETLKGDLYASLNRPDEARAAYGKAKRLGENSVWLQLKLDDLAAEPAQPGS